MGLNPANDCTAVGRAGPTTTFPLSRPWSGLQPGSPPFVIGGSPCAALGTNITKGLTPAIR